MLIDHIGHIFWDGTGDISIPLIMRGIGRVAFPLFALLIAEGCIHTKNMKKYMIRLGIFAIVSQWFFAAFLQVELAQNLNIFFTLLLGVFVIYCYNFVKEKTLIHLLLFIAMFVLVFGIAFELNTDYGGTGVLFIVLLYLAQKSRKKDIFVPLVLLAIVTILYTPTTTFWLVLFIGGLCSALPMVLYNGKLGYNKLKWVFYVFYPAHLFLLVIFRDYVLPVL